MCAAHGIGIRHARRALTAEGQLACAIERAASHQHRTGAMTREDMAKICITTRESVSGTLSAWSKDGIVELRARRILLRDPRRLRDLIQGPDR